MNFVILCGGSGSRLWPKSREKMPKQLLNLTNEYSMLQNTLLRISSLNENLNTQITIICNKEHSHIIETQLENLNIKYPIKIVNEPKGRDSAAAICIASLINDPNNYTTILPADHIMDANIFLECCKKSLSLLEDSIVTFGIKPSYPETGYGYIKMSDNGDTIQFIEKPNLEKAKQYIEEGTYLWNGGMFAFKNKNMIHCYEKYAPDILHNCKITLENTKINKNIIDLPLSYFEKCRSISVDYAIMEKLCDDFDFHLNKKTILYNGYWNDIGSFSSLYDELHPQCDENGNVLKGDIVSLNNQNCYIESENSIIAAINLQNLIIVNTADAILVCNKDSTQDVKKVVDILKTNKKDEVIHHKKVFRPWGWYVNIDGNDHSGFKVKKITVYPNKKLSLQSHNNRSEHWVIVKGQSKVTVGTKEVYLNKDENIYIPIQTLHRIENIGNELLEFTETQIGDYLGEDDIIRYEDDFGRV